MNFITVAALFVLAGANVAQPAERIAANDNRVAAGTLAAKTLRVALDARIAMWYPDGPKGGAVPIAAFAEAGKTAQIPGPLLRAPVGTTIVATIRNSIPGQVLKIHGMVSRPASADHVVAIPYGRQRTIQFRAGAPGTYLYWGSTTAKNISDHFGDDSQLTGAFVVDPPHAKPDRVFVVGQWINVRNKDGSPNFDYELDTINGRSWPSTERLSLANDSTVHWRWVNGSMGSHPLHLHGFYFTVDSRGDGLADNIYPAAQRDSVVTELLEPGHTFTMTARVDRPGNWMFHCHLPYHAMAHLPLNMILAKTPITEEYAENVGLRHGMMGGLVLQFTVRKPANVAIDPPSRIERRIQIKVAAGADDATLAPSYRYLVTQDGRTTGADFSGGPPLILTRGVPTEIEVTNNLNEPTAIHWHGMELADSYYDGVAGYSGYGKRVAPMIDPGKTFDAVMVPRRAGTFIYHTHMNDVWQLRGGLAAPLIVLEPGQKYDPANDHAFTIMTMHAWTDPFPFGLLVNGTQTPAALTVHAGARQRFRFINMTTFWTNALVTLNQGKQPVRWTPLAIDGMNLSKQKQHPEVAMHFVTIGETRDFTFTPNAPGELTLQIWPDPAVPSIVSVPIHVVP